MRTLGLERIAAAMLATISPRNRQLLDRYCAGVNAYLETHRDNLPPDLALARYTPEPWRPLDSALVFCLVNLALSFNVYRRDRNPERGHSPWVSKRRPGCSPSIPTSPCPSRKPPSSLEST
jgi:acyl-homoserine-lactone acylase